MVTSNSVGATQKHQWISDAAKHPLVVLLVATLLGSVLVPLLNGRMERERRRRELKAERATSILRSSWETERKLNLICTAFETFYKDEVVTRTATKESRQAMRDRVYTLYRDFDRDAWWWYWQVLEEVKIYQLVPEARLPEFEQAVRNYQEALVAGATGLDPLWNDLIRRPALISPEEGAKTLSKVKPQLKRLADRRQELIRQMVQAVVD